METSSSLEEVSLMSWSEGGAFEVGSVLQIRLVLSVNRFIVQIPPPLSLPFDKMVGGGNED